MAIIPIRPIDENGNPFPTGSDTSQVLQLFCPLINMNCKGSSCICFRKAEKFIAVIGGNLTSEQQIHNQNVDRNLIFKCTYFSEDIANG